MSDERVDVEKLLDKVEKDILFVDDLRQIAAALRELQAHREAKVDNDRLVRELDIMINGEAGAARQASLCDIVAQLGKFLIERMTLLEGVASCSTCEVCRGASQNALRKIRFTYSE